MARSIRFFLALGALVLCGGVLAACGNSIPSNAIATVGTAPITKASFNHWLTVAQKLSAAQSAGSASVAPLDPPSFSACVAYHQKNDPKPAKGQPNPTPDSLKTACQALFNAARDQVVPFLITADWLQGEAADQGVKVTDTEVANALKASLAGRTPAQIQQFVTQSGETNADLLYRQRINSLSAKLKKKVTSAQVNVSPADITAYYNKNASQFSTPELRDLRIVLVKTLPEAKRVLALLKSQSFGVVAKKYSVDMATKPKGGALIGVKRGDQEQALDAAIFSSPIGKLVGPIKTTFGYEIFRVQKITPAVKKSQAAETALIRTAVIAQRQQDSLTAFIKHFEAKWRSRTNCASGYVVADCKNAPKTSTTSTTGATTPGQ
ncbi:MAG: peptidylprolyl isomerase [Solirubrobacteraceae bacterium]